MLIYYKPVSLPSINIKTTSFEVFLSSTIMFINNVEACIVFKVYKKI